MGKSQILKMGCGASNDPPPVATSSTPPAPQTGENLVTFRFVRHGESLWNALGKAQGQTDIELNDKGKRQAQNIARALAGYPCDAMISSSLKRASVTGRAIHANFPSVPFVEC